MEIITSILWGALQELDAALSFEDVKCLIDEYLCEDGHSLMGLVKEIAAIDRKSVV